MGLLETKVTEDFEIKLDGYHTIRRDRDKTNNAAHGGIAILIKHHIKQGVTEYKCKSPDILAIRLNKSFFNLDKDIYVVYLYISPYNSTFTKKSAVDPFDLIDEDVLRMGNANNNNNYRGISLTSALSKLFGIIMNNRLIIILHSKLNYQ